jgi:hypothetical protein
LLRRSSPKVEVGRGRVHEHHVPEGVAGAVMHLQRLVADAHLVALV